MTTKYFDAIVIGAGITGASVSAHLAETGYKVLILERHKAGCGASGGNLGQISVSDRTEAWHMPLVVESQDFYRKFQRDQYDIEYVNSGGSYVLRGQQQIDAGLKAKQSMSELGVASELLEKKADILNKEPHIDPDSLDALLFCPLEGKLNPFLTTLAFLDLAKKAGAELLTDSPVLGFVFRNGLISEVVTPNGRFRSRYIVNCAGPRAAFVADLANVRLPILFHKGTALVSEPVPPMIRGPLVGGGFFLKGPAKRPRRHVGFGTVQSVTGSILIAQSTEECETDDCTVNAPSLTMISDLFLSYFPQLKDLHMVRAWAAVTTYTADDLPVFGFSGGAENFFTVAGFKGAFSVAPAVGRLTRDALCQTADHTYEMFSPDRTSVNEYIERQSCRATEVL